MHSPRPDAGDDRQIQNRPVRQRHHHDHGKQPDDTDGSGPRYIRREDHTISRKDIDRDSLRVLYGLKDAETLERFVRAG